MPISSPWAASLQPATWRGQSFVCERSSRSGGRRIIVHEYWQKKPWLEDAGIQTILYTIAGFLIGDDVYDQRSAFEANCELNGAGELVHPSYGTVNCTLMSSVFRETYEAGRICDFELTFIETDAPTYSGLAPLQSEATQSKTAAASSNTWDASANDYFNDVGSAIKSGERVVNGVVNTIQGYVNGVQRIVNDATRTVNAVKGLGALFGVGSKSAFAGGGGSVSFGRYSNGFLSAPNSVLGTITNGLSDVRRVEAGVNAVLNNATSTANDVSRGITSVVNLAGLI